MIFSALKPPEPSLLRQHPPVGVPVARGAAPAPPRRTYDHLPDEFMRGGGCFAPEGRVSAVLPDGTVASKRVDEIVKDDVLLTPTGHAAVRCVALTPCMGGRAVFSRVLSADGGEDALQLTEWHPLLDERGVWRFPVMVGERVYRRCSHVYNLVLDTDHVVLINGIGCVTLGHGFEGDVVGHAYYGTAAVIDDLQKLPGWADGRVYVPVPPAALTPTERASAVPTRAAIAAAS